MQNLCRNYFWFDTSDMENSWYYFAEYWISFLKKELDENFQPEIPVFITAKQLRNVLCNNIKKSENCKFHYLNKKYIEPGENELNRVIVPFYRSGTYSLTRSEWNEYKEKIKGSVRLKNFTNI